MIIEREREIVVCLEEKEKERSIMLQLNFFGTLIWIFSIYFTL